MENSIAMIPVCYQSNPFDFKPRSFRAEPGITLLEIVKQVTSQPELFVVKLNGAVIQPEWWSRVRPKVPKRGRPVLVTFHPLPRSDDFKDILGLVATVALVAASAFIAGPVGVGFFAGLGLSATAATVAAAGAAAAVGLAGSLAISALTGPPLAANVQAASGTVTKQVAGVALNQISPGDYLPMVLGTMRASPPPLQPAFTTLENGDIYVQGTVGMAGAYQIENIWLNGSPAELFEDFQYEIRPGLSSDSAPSMNFNYSVLEQQPRLKMSQSKRAANSANLEGSPPDISLADWEIFNLHPPGDTGKFVIRLFWPGGMNAIGFDDSIAPGAMGVRVEIRPRSSSTWYPLPEVVFHQNPTHNGEIRQQITLQWGSITTGTFVPDDNDTSWAAYYSSNEGQPFARLAAAEYDPGGAAILALGVTNDVDGFIIEVDNTVMDGDEEYDVRIKMSHSFSEVSFDPLTYIYVGSAANAGRIWGYTGAGVTATKQMSPGEFVYIESISSWNASEPFDWHGLSSIAFKARRIQIDSLSAQFTSMVPIWDGVAWTTSLQPTNNPAALYRFACMSPDYNSQALPAGVLDEDNMVECWTECVNRQRECNAVIQNQSLPEVLQMIASCMFGSPRYVDTWGVILDKDRSGDDIMQLLTPLNSKDLGTVKEFPRMPHAIRAQYSSKNEENDLRDDVVAFAPGYDAATATIYESITYQGFTDPNKVAERAQFDIDQTYLRSIRYIRDVHHEGLLTPRGSLIGLTDDVVEEVHRYSIITGVVSSGGNVTGLQLETLIDLETLAQSQSYMPPTDAEAGAINQLAITVRLNDGSPSTHLITETEAASEVTFATPVPNTGQFEHPQIVSIGIAGREYKRCLVMAVEPHKGGEMLRLYLADERPELYA